MEAGLIRARHLIRIDWVAGAVAGALLLGLRGWLAELYSLPSELLLAMGIANLAYASVSFTLARRSRGDRVPFLRVVAAANIAWGVGCSIAAALFIEEASVFGTAQLVGEALFVGGLGVLEWRAAARS
jgi:hypothetical protein